MAQEGKRLMVIIKHNKTHDRERGQNLFSLILVPVDTSSTSATTSCHKDLDLACAFDLEERHGNLHRIFLTIFLF